MRSVIFGQGFNFINMEHLNLNKECVVTGKEVIDPQSSPKSSVNGNTWAFCTTTCKEIFDRDLVKFAVKRYSTSAHFGRSLH
jgi:YHS domain-containing protein